MIAVPAAALGIAALSVGAARADNPPTTVQVDAAASRHPIDPRIYGVAYAPSAQLQDLNAPLNRTGGDPTSRYNWKLNADNRGSDWFFESLPYDSPEPGALDDAFIGDSKAGGAEPLLTLPMTDWIANLGPNRAPLWSFSIKKYGAQAASDVNGWADAGNGIAKATGQPIANNDPSDANVPNSSAYQTGWVQHLLDKWGPAGNGGVRYYLLDNEPSAWWNVHRDVEPVGLKMDDYLARAIDYASKVKALDPSAVIVGPEEWGWSGYFYSGYDQQWQNTHNFNGSPDRDAHNGMDYIPWILSQLHQHDQATGQRLLDVLSVHYYPQSGEFSLDGSPDDLSTKMQLLRNRSTRALWDPGYTDVSWINDKVRLLPRLREWANTYYPGTQVGLTEYNWGAEAHINGATAQADILGILGREGIDMATRWTTPDASTPTYKAMKLYRNYDGKKSAFGDTSVAAAVANPDDLAAFAAQRSSDGALTVMVINKDLSGATPVTVSLANFAPGDHAQEWQLTSANAINSLPDVPIVGGALATTAPAQSITLFVVPPAAPPANMPPANMPPANMPPANMPPAAAPAFTATASPAPGSPLAPAAQMTVTATVTDTGAAFDNAIVDVEVYDAAGNQVHQQFWANQNLAANAPQTYTTDPFAAPAAEGTYTVQVGVFNADWSQNLYWNNHAATFAVQQPVNMPPAAPAFMATASLAPASALTPGTPITITATVTDTGAAFANAIVDVEVYDAAGNKIHQQFWPSQNLAMNAPQTYTTDLFAAPAAEGTYTVQVGVFNADWSQNPYWNNHAAVLTIQQPAVPPMKVALPGDVNQDGQVTIGDVVLALEIAVGLDAGTPSGRAAADLDGNGTVDLRDVTALLHQVTFDVKANRVM